MGAENTDLITPWVFVDTAAYRAVGLDWSGKAIVKLRDLCRAGLLHLLVTDVTRREVRSRLKDELDVVLAATRKSDVVFSQLDVDLSSLKDPKKALDVLAQRFDEFLASAKAETVPIAATVPALLDDYFEGRPPFGAGKKKSEFPDAIVIASLREWCRSKQRRVYIVSKDSDMESACSSTGPLFSVGSIAEVVSLATARRETQARLVRALNDSFAFDQEVRRRVEAAHPSHHSMELDDLEAEEVVVDEVNILERTGNRFTAEVEVDVFVRAVMIEDELAPVLDKYGDFEIDTVRRVYTASGDVYLTIEADFEFDSDAGEVSAVHSVDLGTTRYELAVYERGRRETVRFQMR